MRIAPRRLIRVASRLVVAGTALAAVVVVVIPVWLLVRVPAAIEPPDPEGP